MTARDAYTLFGPIVALLFGLGLLISARAPHKLKNKPRPPPRMWILVGIAPGALLLVSHFLGESFAPISWVLLPLHIAIVAADASYKIRDGIADQSSMTAAVGKHAAIWVILWPVLGQNPDQHVGVALLLLGAFALACGLTRRAKLNQIQLVMLLVGIPLLTARAFLHAPGPDLDDAAAWTESFDQPADELLDWRQFGWYTSWMRARGQPLDLAVATRRMRGFPIDEVSPQAFVGASDAEILEPEDVRAYRNARGSLERMREWLRFRATPESVQMLLPDLTDAQRAQTAAQIDAVWPIGFSSLETIHDLVRSLELLGAQDRIDARRDDIRASLAASISEDDHSWVGAPRGAMGFISRQGKDHIDDDENWMALALMSRVGVPDGIDLLAFEKYLQAESGMALWRPFDKMDVHHRLARVSLLRLRLDWDHTRPAWHRYRRYANLIGLLCLALMCIAVLARARRLGNPVPEDRELDTVFS